jgi:glucosamine--fructose-6-phosphate aminotransferase (isomerizing)
VSNRLPVALAALSLFTLYQTPPCLEDALVIGVSQSGRSTDIVEVLKEARRQGACTLAIANDADSPLAQTAEHVILSCGDQGVTRGRPWSSFRSEPQATARA